MMFCQIIVMLWLIGTTSCYFLPVSDGCKYWSYLNVYGNGEGKHLHCILDQVYQPGLVYTKVKKIEKGRCPIYNRYAKQIDSIRCTSGIEDCPQKIIDSYEGVKYSGCYDRIWKHTNLITHTRNEDWHTPSTVSTNTSNNTALVVIVTLLASIVGMTICLCLGYYVCRFKIKIYRESRKRYRQEGKAFSPSDINATFDTKKMGNADEQSKPILGGNQQALTGGEQNTSMQGENQQASTRVFADRDQQRQEDVPSATTNYERHGEIHQLMHSPKKLDKALAPRMYPEDESQQHSKGCSRNERKLRNVPVSTANGLDVS